MDLPSYVCNVTRLSKAIHVGASESLQRLSRLISTCSTLTRHASNVFKLYFLYYQTDSKVNDFELDTIDYQKIYSYILYLLNNDFQPDKKDNQILLEFVRRVV